MVDGVKQRHTPLSEQIRRHHEGHLNFVKMAMLIVYAYVLDELES